MKDKSLIRGRHDTGQYIIAGNEPCAEDIRDWILKGGFRQYEKQALRFGLRGRSKNKLYSFHLPETGCEVVMKTCHPAPEYKWPRQFELALRQYFRDYNKTAFLGCRMMYLAEIPVACPFAYWNVRRSFFDQTSYFLYQKIQSDYSLNEWCKTIRQSGYDNAADLIEAVKAKAIKVVKAMHDAGFRHSDPHGNNFLVKPVTTASLLPCDIEKTAYYLIDYEHCTRATIQIPLIKRFFDLREFRRIHIDEAGPHQLLDIYLDGKQSRYAHAILEFWHRGGFHLWHRVAAAMRQKRSRHLKKSTPRS